MDDQTIPALPATASALVRPSAVRWQIFAFIAALTVINLTDRTAIAIGMPTIAHEFALPPFTQGLILSAFFWTYALMQIPGGWLIDRIGPSRIIGGATLLWGFFQGVTMFATGSVSLLGLRLGLGVAEAPLFPAGGKLNALWLAPQERGRGAVIMDSGSYLGAALGGLLISWLILTLGSWRLAFGLAGLATMGLGLLALRILHDDPRSHPRVNAAELRTITTAAPATGPGAPCVALVARRGVVAIMAGRLGWAMINFGLLTWGPSYLTQARGLDLKQMGMASFAIFGAGCLGALGAGFLSDRLQQRGAPRNMVLKTMLGLSGLAVLGAFLALPHVTSAVMAIWLLAGTYFMVGWGSLYWSFPALLAQPAAAGMVGGLMNFAGSVGGIIVPILAGAILQRSGSYNAVLLMFAGCAALYVCGTLLIPFGRTNSTGRRA